MASDLGDIEDAKGNSIELEMNARGVLLIHCASVDGIDPDARSGPEMVTLTLKPDAEGVARAKTLRDALDEWINHVGQR
jgi:hypothetical protein